MMSDLRKTIISKIGRIPETGTIAECADEIINDVRADVKRRCIETVVNYFYDLPRCIDDTDAMELADEVCKAISEEEVQKAGVCHKAINSCKEIREIYAGRNGYVCETPLEIYQERIIKQMYDQAAKAYKYRM